MTTSVYSLGIHLTPIRLFRRILVIGLVSPIKGRVFVSNGDGFLGQSNRLRFRCAISRRFRGLVPFGLSQAYSPVFMLIEVMCP